VTGTSLLIENIKEFSKLKTKKTKINSTLDIIAILAWRVT